MSYVEHRKRSRHQGWLPPIHKPPLLRRTWQTLTPEQRNYITSYSWSFLFSTLMLVSLAAISITAQQLEHTAIQLSAVEANSEEPSFELSDDIELEPLSEVLQDEQASLATVLDNQALPQLQLPSLSGSGGSDGEVGPNGLSNLSGRELGLMSDTDRRILKAGGSLKGLIRVSLSFTGIDDIDLHVVCEVPHYNRPRNANKSPVMSSVETYHVFFGNKQTKYASLDVDANAQGIMPEPCENIVFHKKPLSARYTIALDNYTEREDPAETPYVVVIKYGSTVKVFEGNLQPTDRMKIIYSFDY